jgi:predicted nucleotidyltransferase
MMAKSPIREIAEKANENGVSFLVIGGYAVFAHGYVRATDDLDLIVSREHRVAWTKLLVGFGMTIKNDAATFLQFDPANEAGMKVDLMFVSDEVFTKLNEAAVQTEIEGTRIKVAALLHLIALKCHALEHSKSIRRLKDMDDLIHLILINRLDLNKEELRAIIIKHGSLEIYEKLQHACTDE